MGLLIVGMCSDQAATLACSRTADSSTDAEYYGFNRRGHSERARVFNLRTALPDLTHRSHRVYHSLAHVSIPVSFCSAN